MNRSFLALISLVFVFLTVYLLWKQNREKPEEEIREITPFSQDVVLRTFNNYHEEIRPLALRFDVPEEYLLALIALESSGRKIVPHRFESHIYHKLEQLKAGKIARIEHVKSSDLSNSSAEELKDLASSWGPFQIMGYKCFELGIPLDDLKTKKTIESSVVWVKRNYGTMLSRNEFRDAFHFHNTGRKYPRFGPPRTHDSAYVPRGLKYMGEFKLLLAEKANNPREVEIGA
ncbi:MAG: hypothetical protein H6606_08410 [Flavobacteriales bacterium]|nr:hypothetical protein [Flavobacteriales bacterium]